MNEKPILLNAVESINPEMGSYLVLSDFRTEGLKVVAQESSIEGVIQFLMHGFSGDPKVVVKLVEVKLGSALP